MKNVLVMAILLTSLTGMSCRRTAVVDLIVKNSKVYTVDGKFSIAESFAVAGGKIVAIGTNREISSLYQSERVVDLQGRPVYPGFYDAHCHFFGYASSLRNADLTATTSQEDIYNRLIVKQKENPTDWILGRGWDQNDWVIKQFPDRKVLDSLFPSKPVYLTRVDGHAAWVNATALRMAGIDGRTRVAGGEILRENGKSTGILIDNAMDLVSSLIPEMSEDEAAAALTQAQQNCFAVGLTSVADAGLGASTVRLMDRMQQDGRLKMRVYAMLAPTTENLEGFLGKGAYKTDRLDVRSIKLYADGALGSRGALLLKPYNDDPGRSGLQVNGKAWLEAMCRKAYDAGYQVCTHCIGDSANRLMLTLYKEILKGPNDRRWRIEHAQVIHPDDFQLFGAFNIIPSVQFVHATSDMYWAADRLGPERMAGAYAYRKLLDQNGWLPNGSDFPVENIHPLYGFFAGFARMDRSGWPSGGWMTENGLTREECLKAMTIWAARSCFEDNERGSLEPGKLADFTVLGEDIMTIEPLRVPAVRTAQTWIGGECVYSNEKADKQ